MSIYKLYEELYDAVYATENPTFKEKELSNFVAMRGERYNENNPVRFMLVGRAVNGWGKSLSLSSKEAYAAGAEKLFSNTNRFQSEWKMQNDGISYYSPYQEADKNGKTVDKKYYLSKSPFWNTAEKIYKELSKNFYACRSDWFNDIVWNNIYKIAPLKAGNPSTNLIYAQAKTCVKLLREETEQLKPTHILMPVDKSWLSWTSRGKIMFDFTEAFGDYNCRCRNIEKNTEYNIVQCAFTRGNCKVIVSCRPENVPQDEYCKAVCDAFSQM